MPDTNPADDSDINDPFDYIVFPACDSSDEFECNQDHLFNDHSNHNRSASTFDTQTNMWNLFGASVYNYIT